jgi:hypothetical protein
MKRVNDRTETESLEFMVESMPEIGGNVQRVGRAQLLFWRHMR